MEVIANEIVNNKQENLKYNPLENSGNVLFDNSRDPDSHFF